MNIKKTDWHYKLANFGTKRIFFSEMNFCPYVKCVFWGFLNLLFTILITFLAVGYALWVFRELYNWLVYQVPLSQGVVPFLGILSSLVVIAIFVTLIDVIKKQIKKLDLVEKPKSDGFFVTLYKRFKEKTCITVKIED